MKEHHDHVIDIESFQRIDIKRSRIFDDTLAAFSDIKFNPHKLLKVRFAGESAVDDGGPRREFFRLACQQILSSSLFAGWPNNVILIHNISDLTLNHYYVIGKILAVCIIQGGQPPACFSKAVSDYLVYEKITSPPCIDDVPSIDIQSSLKKVII